MPVTPRISALIAERAPMDQVQRAAEAFGYVPMWRRALKWVVEGRTSLVEAQRMVYIDSFADDQPFETELLRLAA